MYVNLNVAPFQTHESDLL